MPDMKCCTLQRIRVRGEVSTQAQLFVSGHRHLLDGFVLCWLLRAPAFLARMSMCKLPMYGTILQALNCVFVDGQETASRQHAAAAVARRCSVTTQVARICSPDATSLRRHRFLAEHLLISSLSSCRAEFSRPSLGGIPRRRHQLRTHWGAVALQDRGI